MPLPKLKLPKLSTPGRQVVLLPDDCFFIRSLPLDIGAEAGTVESQVELALEGMAPFPVAQLYYGYWTRPGVDRVLVFAAYRRRFSAEETAGWAQADLVVPRFAMLLGAEPPEPATTWVLSSAEGLTAMHFADASGVPTLVRNEAVPEEEGATARVVRRDQLLRTLGGTRQLFEVPEVALEPGEPGEGDFETRAGVLRSELTVTQAEALDVRDKADLTARRRGRVRDRWLWRGLLAGVFIIAACALVELALVGLQAWQNVRLKRIAQQTPVVTEVMTAQSLATRIEELSTRRLRVFEMLDEATRPMPDSIIFVSATTSGLHTLEVQGRTGSQTDLDQYRQALEALPTVDNAPLEIQRTQGNETTFRLMVNFSPNAFVTPMEGGAE